MLSFRSILIATAAFATITSAIPTPANIDTNSIGGVLTGLTGSISGGGLRRSLEDDVVPAGLLQPSSPGDIFKKCSDGVALIVVKIEDAVNVDHGGFDHGVVIGHFGEILELLKVALKELKSIVKTDLVLDDDSDGVACTLEELAEIVADLLILVIKTVWLVLSIVGFVDVTLCSVIASIGALLYELLKLVLTLVDGLLDDVVVLIEPFADQCRFVHYTGLLLILGIKL